MTIKSGKYVYKNLDFSLHNVSTAKWYGLITATQVTVCECNMKRRKTSQLKWSTKHCTDGKVTFSQCICSTTLCARYSVCLNELYLAELLSGQKRQQVTWSDKNRRQEALNSMHFSVCGYTAISVGQKAVSIKILHRGRGVPLWCPI